MTQTQSDHAFEPTVDRIYWGLTGAHDRSVGTEHRPVATTPPNDSVRLVALRGHTRTNTGRK